MTPGVHEDCGIRPGGGAACPAQLTPALYREMRRIAARHLSSERPNHTLQATALAHEAYLKLAGFRQAYADNVHFLAVASRAMRQVLVDYARARTAHKRLGDANRQPLWPAAIEMKVEGGAELADLIALDGALASLAAENGVLARLIEMHYFGGVTAEESAVALGLSVHVVRHDLRFAQAWLRRKLLS
jgi:RNA polymerase sigma-70 factor (ECF subfamily)